MRYLVRIGGEELEVELEGERVTLDGVSTHGYVNDVEGTPFRLVRLGESVHRVVAKRGIQRGSYTLSLGGYRFHVEALDERTRAIRELSGAAAGPTGPAPLVAPMPGLVVRVLAAEGDTIQAGQGLVVIEAMKMENELRAQTAGVVRRVHVSPGTAVEKGALLIEME